MVLDFQSDLYLLNIFNFKLTSDLTDRLGKCFKVLLYRVVTVASTVFAVGLYFVQSTVRLSTEGIMT